MTGEVALDAGQQDLLREAAAWRLLGLLFECPCPAWRRNVRALAREVDAAPLQKAAYAALKQASEGLYHSTFGPGGPAPVREAACRPTIELGSLLADLEAFYHAFHYQPAGTEPPDHVAVETGFVSYLHLKQAYAAASGNREAAEITRQAVQRFLEDHLRVLAGPLAGALRHSPVSYLKMAGEELGRRTGACAEEPVHASIFPLLEPTFDCGTPECPLAGDLACSTGQE